MSVILKFALLCDDVRREDNGKLIFIGVYVKDIRVTELPANLYLSLVLCLEVLEQIETDFEFQCVSNGEKKYTGNGRVIFHEPGVNIITLPRMFISDIGQETTLEFQYRLNGEEWQLAHSIPVTSNLGASA